MRRIVRVAAVAAVVLVLLPVACFRVLTHGPVSAAREHVEQMRRREFDAAHAGLASERRRRTTPADLGREAAIHEWLYRSEPAVESWVCRSLPGDEATVDLGVYRPSAIGRPGGTTTYSIRLAREDGAWCILDVDEGIGGDPWTEAWIDAMLELP